jgi:hypothetical protein
VSLLFQEKIRKFTFSKSVRFCDYEVDFGANVLSITQVNERLIAKTLTIIVGI